MGLGLAMPLAPAIQNTIENPVQRSKPVWLVTLITVGTTIDQSSTGG